MAPRKKTGRATAEAAYADLLKEHTALVGDVGEAWDAYVALLEDTAAARERYEESRVTAIKRGAITNDQLDQLGYKKTPKLPAPPPRTPAAGDGPEESKADGGPARGSSSDSQTNGASAGPALASVGAANRGEYS